MWWIAGDLLLQSSISETTLSDDVVDNDVNIKVDLNVGMYVDMKSMSSVRIESVASSLDDNKEIQVVIPDHH
ncbi:hypothetical protein RO3G_09523 [Rhizopus delemar RA 99-880]|uniref:Uncharacterized protein n=1 Tax=Rhizopus delemar (strain RA 99-880 / ATCC MYA-4621 / FGSC 9543 / NRRL 43880) TaxID=246409 RepID=I1C8N3_RHIO9|nr:hypothetical protein RO3G_09523 [Rhizopus delemar RA 99-880]|eukprot:EIE84813.1 hypothetical protein RO3G_09523 [Rhizopus delemar RA 99-880]